MQADYALDGQYLLFNSQEATIVFCAVEQSGLLIIRIAVGFCGLLLLTSGLLWHRHRKKHRKI